MFQALYYNKKDMWINSRVVNNPDSDWHRERPNFFKMKNGKLSMF